MKQQTKSTDASSAATCTGSQPSSTSTKAQYQQLREMLAEGSWNPFQRADGQMLEKLHREAAKRVIERTEDAWL